jgi:hypothetical protein
MQILVEVPYFHKERVVSFLVDSGSVFSAITEKEVSLMGIDCDLLPEAKGEAIGFGGFFKNRMINRPVFLTFDSGKDKHRMNYSSGLKVVCIPPGIDEKDRERYTRFTPCVLGMDILCKFETRISRNKLELELIK